MTSNPHSSPAAELELREQQLQVGVVRTPVERVVLRRRIVTEVRQIQVSVRREELEVLREPLSGQGVPASDAARAPLVIELSQEVPVVELQRRPYEQVTVRVDIATGTQQVTETVAKEQAEFTTTQAPSVAPRPGPGSAGHSLDKEQQS